MQEIYCIFFIHCCMIIKIRHFIICFIQIEIVLLCDYVKSVVIPQDVVLLEGPMVKSLNTGIIK